MSALRFSGELTLIGAACSARRRRLPLLRTVVVECPKGDVLMGRNGRPRQACTLPGHGADSPRCVSDRTRIRGAAVAFPFICRSGRLARHMETAICPQCGTEFPAQHPRSGYRRTFCSKQCAGRAGTHTATPWQDRFWRHIPDPRPDGCWEWIGERDGKGYGALAITHRPNRTMRVAHRASWEIHYGVIPAGMVICHRCDNPPCVNPEHLFLGTQADNVADMDAKGRRGFRFRYSQETLDEIRALRAEGLTHRGISARVGVSVTHIGQVLLGNVTEGRR